MVLWPERSLINRFNCNEWFGSLQLLYKHQFNLLLMLNARGSCWGHFSMFITLGQVNMNQFKSTKLCCVLNEDDVPSEFEIFHSSPCDYGTINLALTVA